MQYRRTLFRGKVPDMDRILVEWGYGEDVRDDTERDIGERL
jgi:hypothetical protein